MEVSNKDNNTPNNGYVKSMVNEVIPVFLVLFVIYFEPMTGKIRSFCLCCLELVDYLVMIKDTVNVEKVQCWIKITYYSQK